MPSHSDARVGKGRGSCWGWSNLEDMLVLERAILIDGKILKLSDAEISRLMDRTSQGQLIAGPPTGTIQQRRKRLLASDTRETSSTQTDADAEVSISTGERRSDKRCCTGVTLYASQERPIHETNSSG